MNIERDVHRTIMNIERDMQG